MVGIFARGNVGQLARRISVGPKSYGYKPGLPIVRGVLGHTPALQGLFRSGRLVVGISQINAMATNVLRGSGY
jgi:hypothetical protein